jgi:hypothetical protein
MTRNRRRSILLVVLAAVVAASWLLRARREAPVAAPPGETWPDGDWILAAPAGEPPDEALARQLSLPYSAGGRRAVAGERTGVVAWDRDRAQPGWNLYVSGHGHEAILLGMDGAALHRWRTRLSAAFPGVPRSPDGGSFRRAALLADGSLLALVQGTGIVKLDARSRVVWWHAEPLFNDLWVAPDESRILVLSKRAVERPDLRAAGPILEDSIVTLDASGEVVARASLLAAFERSTFRDLIFPLGESADILHSNTLEVLDGPGAADSGPLARGNLLVSLREIDTVALLDPTGSDVLWARRGPFRRQHEPTLTPDGRILLFDNRGGAEGTSRVVALDVASGELETLFASSPERPFASPEAGVCRRLGNGNLLVVSSEQGVAWEIAPGGEIVWELRSPHRAGARGQLVASLFDVVRYEAPTPFLARFPLPHSP